MALDLESMSTDELEALYEQEKARLAGVPPGATPAPEYGEGAYKTADGMVMRGKQVLRGAQTAGAEARTRLKLGLGPTIEAQRNLYKAEGWDPDRSKPGKDRLGRNPYDTPRAVAANLIRGKEGGPLRTIAAKNVGGQDFQDYEQASKSFEAAFMPILSGAAVTESEAQRLIRASLPEPGDTPQTLAKKARNRAMMINAAAELTGEPHPFPRVGVFDFAGAVAAAKPVVAATPNLLRRDGGGRAGPAARLRWNPETGELE